MSKKALHPSTSSITHSKDSNSSSGSSGIRRNVGSSKSSSSSTREVRAVRILFLVCLSSIAVALGCLAHYFLTSGEKELAEQQFASIAERALTEAHGTAERKRWSTIAMASAVSAMLPLAEEWPFVYVKDFERIVKNIVRTSAGDDMGFVPLVALEQQAAFEEFAYDYFETIRNFPNDTTVSSFGKGIWFANPASDAPDKRFHVTTGDTDYGSPNAILTPVFHVDEGADPILLMNLHSEPGQGRAIDDMLECSSNLKKATTASTLVEEEEDEDYRCGVVTSKVQYVKYQNFGPTSMIFQPIYPANNRTTVVGFISTPLLWDRVLENVFADNVNGVDCILRISGTDDVSTYTVEEGKANYMGAGDFHQSKYDYLKQSIVLTGGGLYTKNSPIYELELYPNDNFYDGYSTNNPMVATIAAVASILLISGFFFLYDFFVRREFLAKKNLLDAKRQFMRFVSHEVRTPLNSVCMGLTVIQTELAASLGYSSPTDVQLLRGGELSTDSKDDSSKGAILEWFQLLQEIQSNAQIAVDVLSDLLNYDKIEQGNSSLELTALPICQLIERTTNEFRLPAAKKNIALQFRILVGNSSGGEEEEEEEEAAPPNEEEEGLPQHFRELKLIGDAFRVTQALRNLISNAIKFTPEQGTVHVEAVWWKSSDVNNTHVFTSKRGKEVAVESNGSIQVRVKDSGVGLSEEQVQNLFRDGIQFDVNELQAGQGSGLGLFIAKGIVKQHQGSLEANSEGKGLGTTFTITLPVYNLQETPAENINNDATTEDQTQRSDASKPPLPLRILIVDDVSSNRKLLHCLLKRKGHLCEDAENGAVAVDMVVKAVMDGDPFDIVLMDYEMPEMTGPEAAAAIRAKGSDVFIVGITGNLLPEDVAHFRSRGASAVMSKPFNMDDLEERWTEHKKCMSVAKILGDGSTAAASLRCEDKKEFAARPA